MISVESIKTRIFACNARGLQLEPSRNNEKIGDKGERNSLPEGVGVEAGRQGNDFRVPGGSAPSMSL